ncbi:MAG: glycogen-binding domain-containing protein [Candidatus Omnitrophica bacterium]|nr:glycogen-binding domain-containing protein [Candidatus Omnitrophota bacterium]
MSLKNVFKEEAMAMKDARLQQAQQRKIDFDKTAFQLMAPEATKVTLTGDFAKWDASGIPMKKSKTGLWKAEVALKPGRYEYKFVVDGQWWNDPANSKMVRNAHGTYNSVIEVK